MAHGAQLPSPGRRGRFGAPGARLSRGGTRGIFLVQRTCLCPQSLWEEGEPFRRAALHTALSPCPGQGSSRVPSAHVGDRTHQLKSDGGSTSSRHCPERAHLEILTVKSLSAIFSLSGTLGAPSDRRPRAQRSHGTGLRCHRGSAHGPIRRVSVRSGSARDSSSLDVPLPRVTFSCCHSACH